MYEISSPLVVKGDGIPAEIFLSDGTNNFGIKMPIIASDKEFILPDTDGTINQFIEKTATGSTWSSITQFNPNSSLPLFIKCDDNLGIAISTNSSTYITVSSFIYRGTDNDNIISSIKAIVETDLGVNGQVRIFDFTNSQIIAESATFNLSTKSIIDLGTISNLPTTEAIFEVGVRKDSGLVGLVAIYAAHLYG